MDDDDVTQTRASIVFEQELGESELLQQFFKVGGMILHHFSVSKVTSRGFLH